MAREHIGYSGSGYNRVRLEREPGDPTIHEVHDPEPRAVTELVEGIDDLLGMLAPSLAAELRLTRPKKGRR